MNVLVYAHRREAHRHEEYSAWLHEIIHSDSSFGVSDLVLSGFLRVVSHPRIFKVPTPQQTALDFVRKLRNQPNAALISPGIRHWEIFLRLCETTEAKGGLIADAYHAALAIESGAEWISADRDYARFPGLRWRHPLD